MAITAVFCIFCGCSQDDDMYDNSEMYTLAEEMGTRLGGDPGGIKPKNRVYWKKKGSINANNPTGFSNPINMSSPASLPNSTDPILYGEYDTDTLVVSISNFDGHATICVTQGDNMMDSIGTNIVGGTTINFSLSGYTTGLGYNIDVALSDTCGYVGEFDL